MGSIIILIVDLHARLMEHLPAFVASGGGGMMGKVGIDNLICKERHNSVGTINPNGVEG